MKRKTQKRESEYEREKERREIRLTVYSPMRKPTRNVSRFFLFHDQIVVVTSFAWSTDAKTGATKCNDDARNFFRGPNSFDSSRVAPRARLRAGVFWK